jgi:predicted nucleotidyltransferase
MQDVSAIKRTISAHKAELRKKYKVKTIGVFGSYVRGEQNKKSDVDVLVEFEEPVGLFEFMALENYLSD